MDLFQLVVTALRPVSAAANHWTAYCTSWSAGVQVEPELDALAVGFDGFDAYIEKVRGLAGAQPLANEMEYLKFAFAETVDGVGGEPRRADCELFGDDIVDVVGEVNTAREDPAQRDDDLLNR